MKKAASIVVSLAMVSLFAVPLSAGAQVYSPYGYQTSPTYPAYTTYPTSAYQTGCPSLYQNLYYGMSGSAVSSLQQFLTNQGLLSTGLITGFFGGATLRAVETFQYNHDLPSTGYVGQLTLQAIAATGCGGTSYNGGYPYNNGGYYSSYPPTITSLSTTSGLPGTQVTIYGTGFDPINNIVNFNGQTESGIPSNGGTSLTFAVPYLNSSSCSSAYSYSYGGCYSYQTYPYQNYQNQQQTYPVSVTTSRGTSNSLQFTITSNGYYNGGGYGYSTPTISYITPTTGSVNTTVTIYGSGFSAQGNIIHFGSGAIQNISSYNGTTLSFTIPSSIGPYCQPYTACPQYVQSITNGSYPLYVTNSTGGTSNSVSFNVTNGYYGNGNGPISVSNVNGPTTLNINQQGTWTVTINDQSGGYINASVQWGDQQYNSGNQTVQQQLYQGQQTLSFTHSYYTTGTYTITFTFSDSYGNETSTTMTVYVN